MSTLKVNELQNTSGANASTIDDIRQGRAKAWVNFRGSGTVSIRDHFNCSSITDNGVGNYTVNYANAIPNSNDCAVAWGMRATTSDSNYLTWRHSTPNVNNMNVRSAFNWSSGGVATDLDYYYMVVFSD